MAMLDKMIVMLTNNDFTVKDAKACFLACKNLPIVNWGFKEEGIPFEEMVELNNLMHEAGKTTWLEVVAYTEEECMAGAKMAVDAGFDNLCGTIFFESVNEYCKANNISYNPFVGTVVDRPSNLHGSVEMMLEQAEQYKAAGAQGLDLLGYRWRDGDPEVMIREFLAKTPLPTCVAGSIGSEARLDTVRDFDPAYFTMGSALFNGNFVKDGTFAENLCYVAGYLKNM